MEQQLTNTTNAILHQLKHGWNSPRATVIRIEALVVIAAFLSFFLLIFGSCRRWCTHWFIQKGVLGAYIFSFSLVTYTMGSMQSSAARNEMFPVWAISLLAVLGCTNSITAYSLNDNKQYLTHSIQQFLYMGYTLLIIFTITSDVAIIAAFLLFFDTYQKNGMRLFACRLACESWNPNKQVADYMDEEDKSDESEYNPVSMKGYSYLVRWNTSQMKLNATTGYKRKMVAGDGLVTIDKIWQCNHGLLGSNDDASGELKDVCLSFALFHLLKRRYFGFPCAEARQQKTHDFVFKGLLSKREHGYERAFKVIEVELSFLYDFFYTKYAFIHHMEQGVLFWAIITVFLICFLGAVTVVRKIRIDSSSDAIIVVNTKIEDLVITLAVLASLALLQVIQAILYLASNWSKVALACDYVLRPQMKGFGNCIQRIKEVFIRFHLFDKYNWQHKLGQYSLLESYAYNSRRNCSGKTRALPSGLSNGNFRLSNKIKGLWYGFRSRCKRLITSSPLYGLFKENGIEGHEKGKPTILSVQVKMAIAKALRRTDGHIKKQTSSLQSNEVPNNISRNFQFLPETHTILIWHIATCYCEMAPSSFCTSEDTEEGKLLKDNHDVATQLSKYCAYLVVFAPELLPGHQWNTSELFNAVVKEAMHFLEGAEPESIYQTMKSLEDSTNTIFQRGASLGKQLERISSASERWQLMADFWVEMMLYVAPSENVREHIEHLAKGGEFITHLWALLFHAGIVKHGEEDHIL